MTQNRTQRRQEQSIKGVSKTQLMARAQAAEASTQMFRQFYEEQIRSNERIVIEAEQLVQKAQLEQRATERTIEVMLHQLTEHDVYIVTQDIIDSFNAQDEDGEHFVNVEQTDDGFNMTLVFEAYELEGDDGEDGEGTPAEDDDLEDSGSDGEETTDGVPDDAS